MLWHKRRTHNCGIHARDEAVCGIHDALPRIPSANPASTYRLPQAPCQITGNSRPRVLVCFHHYALVPSEEPRHSP
jgi:hypothetical protein